MERMWKLKEDISYFQCLISDQQMLYVKATPPGTTNGNIFFLCSIACFEVCLRIPVKLKFKETAVIGLEN